MYRIENDDDDEITPVSLANATGWFSLVFGEAANPTHHPMHAATRQQQQQQGEVYLSLYIIYFTNSLKLTECVYGQHHHHSLSTQQAQMTRTAKTYGAARDREGTMARELKTHRVSSQVCFFSIFSFS